MLIQNQLNALIPRRSSFCHGHMETFAPGDDYVSLLILKDEKWDRKDYCLSCFEKKPEEQVETFWRGKIPEKKRSPHERRDEKAVQVFKELIEQNEQKLLFVLALYLERQKQLQRRTELKSKDHVFYELLETGEIYSLQRIALTAEEAQSLSRELFEKLKDE